MQLSETIGLNLVLQPALWFCSLLWIISRGHSQSITTMHNSFQHALYTTSNGVGKSTLIKLIMGQLTPIDGWVELSGNARVTCFSQHHVDQLNLKQTPLEFMMTLFASTPPQELRRHLGRFGVTGDLALQKIATLSGGQKSRVAFAVVTFTRPHLLILDEPTNHLDLETVDALIMAINQFEGGVMAISHDQHLLSSCIDECVGLLVLASRSVACGPHGESFRFLVAYSSTAADSGPFTTARCASSRHSRRPRPSRSRAFSSRQTIPPTASSARPRRSAAAHPRRHPHRRVRRPRRASEDLLVYIHSYHDQPHWNF